MQIESPSRRRSLLSFWPLSNALFFYMIDEGVSSSVHPAGMSLRYQQKNKKNKGTGEILLVC